MQNYKNHLDNRENSVTNEKTRKTFENQSQSMKQKTLKKEKKTMHEHEQGGKLLPLGCLDSIGFSETLASAVFKRPMLTQTPCLVENK